MAKRVIVAGVDFSPCSRRALDVAGSLALDTDARVVLVHAFPGTKAAAALAGTLSGSLPPPQLEFQGDVELEDAQDLSQDWAEPLRGQGIDVTVEAAPGKASALILDAIQRHGAFLAVVGTHGRSGLRRLGIGSVAQDLVRHSHVPVLVVPLPEGPASRNT